MHRSSTLIVLAIFCLLSSFTVRAQNVPYYYSDETTEKTKTNNYGETTEKTYSNNYGETTEKTGNYQYSYSSDHEKTYNYDYSSDHEENTYYAPYNYGYSDTAEKSYSSYNNENYNYNNGSYGGDEATYGQQTSYNSGKSYTGQYDSSSSSQVPQFPTSLLTGFVCDIHFLAVDPRFQYIAYHYCSDLFPGYTQCAIYNGTDVGSRLVATEIVVSETIFKTLPMEERVLWHSHAFAVKNGLLVLPGVPADKEEQVYMGVMKTYGKVVDYWHSFQDFPLGAPRLAYGIAATSQINATIANQLDKSLKLTTTWQQRQAARQSWAMPDIVEGADDYLTSGKFPQYVIKQFDVNAVK